MEFCEYPGGCWIPELEAECDRLRGGRYGKLRRWRQVRTNLLLRCVAA